jgi:hypothetical protein
MKSMSFEVRRANLGLNFKISPGFVVRGWLNSGLSNKIEGQEQHQPDYFYLVHVES